MRKCYSDAAWKLSKYGVIFGPNTGKYGPEITPYLDTLHPVKDMGISLTEFRVLQIWKFANIFVFIWK